MKVTVSIYLVGLYVCVRNNWDKKKKKMPGITKLLKIERELFVLWLLILNYVPIHFAKNDHIIYYFNWGIFLKWKGLLFIFIFMPGKTINQDYLWKLGHMFTVIMNLGSKYLLSP